MCCDGEVFVVEVDGFVVGYVVVVCYWYVLGLWVDVCDVVLYIDVFVYGDDFVCVWEWYVWIFWMMFFEFVVE